MWLLIYNGIQVNPCHYKGPRRIYTNGQFCIECESIYFEIFNMGAMSQRNYYKNDVPGEQQDLKFGIVIW